MGAYTNRLAIYLMGGGLSGTNVPDEQVDIDKINAGFVALDAAIGAVVCTSTTRPSSPYNGDLIYETDTRNIRVWVTSVGNWVVPNDNILVATLDDLNVLSAAGEGQIVHVDELGCNFQAIDTVWVQITEATVADNTARDTAYGRAAGVYKVAATAKVYRQDKFWHEEWFTTAQGVAVAGWFPVSGMLPRGKVTRAAAGTINLVNNASTNADSILTVTEIAKDVTVTAGTLVISQAGEYDFEGSMSVIAAAGGARYLDIVKVTPGTVIDHDANGGNAASDSGVHPRRVGYKCAVGDVFRLVYFQNSGGAIPITAGEYGMRLAATYRGPA